MTGPVGIPPTKTSARLSARTNARTNARTYPTPKRRRNQTQSHGNDVANAAAMLAAKREGAPGGRTGDALPFARPESPEEPRYPRPSENDTPHKRAAIHDVLVSVMKTKLPNTSGPASGAPGPGAPAPAGPGPGGPGPGGLPSLPTQEPVMDMAGWVDQQPWGSAFRSQRRIPKQQMDQVTKMYTAYRKQAGDAAAAGQQQFDNQMTLHNAQASGGGASGLRNRAADQLSAGSPEDPGAAYQQLAGLGRQPKEQGGIMTARGIEEQVIGFMGQGGWEGQFKKDPVGTFVKVNAYMQSQGAVMYSPSQRQSLMQFVASRMPPVSARKTWFAANYGDTMPEDTAKAQEWAKVFGATFPDIVAAQKAPATPPGAATPGTAQPFGGGAP